MLRRYHSLILLPCSMRQIPFTVPNQGVDKGRLARGSSEEYQPSGGLSEPSSPCVKRPSVEIPGIYLFFNLISIFIKKLSLLIIAIVRIQAFTILIKKKYMSQVVLVSLCNLKYKGDICTSYLYYLCIVCFTYFLLIQLKTLVVCVHRNCSPNKHLQKLKLYPRIFELFKYPDKYTSRMR